MSGDNGTHFETGARGGLPRVTRPRFLRLMGASLALAGLTACSPVPTKQLVPYVRRPEDLVPGKPLFYATAFALSGYATGVLVQSQMGRPVKIEGNPDHPASLGATDAITQASILNLYDPYRSQVVKARGEIRAWEEFQRALVAKLGQLHQQNGRGLRILSETVTSPTLANQIKTLLGQLKQAQWHQYEPVNRDSSRAGARLAFGGDVDTLYHFDKADVVVSLDADFLMQLPGSIRYARDFVARRRPVGNTPANRLYVVESTPTVTGAVADRRLPLRAADVLGFAQALAAALGTPSVPAPATAPSGARATWITTIVKDLQQHRGASLIVPGDRQPPAVHLLAHAMNQALGAVGNAVTYAQPVEASPTDQLASIVGLTRDMAAGQVDTLVILGGNPVYNAPVDLRFAAALQKVPFKIHLGLSDDETAALADWHIPETHYLEAWSDARAFDGTVSLVQPLIAPLYQGKSAHEILSLFTDPPGRAGYDIVRAYWQSQHQNDFDAFWREALNDGLIANTAAAPTDVTLKPIDPAVLAPPGAGDGSLELTFRPDPTIYDGRFADNAWLQELPKNLTKLTWDNVALFSPATAARLGIVNEDEVELRYRGGSLVAPAWILPGQPDDSVSIQLGYGRSEAGEVGKGIGFNAYLLRTSDAPWFGSGLQVRKTGGQYHLAATHDHWTMEGRRIVVSGTLDQFAKDPNFVKRGSKPPPGSLYPPFRYDGYKWGMSINLTSCIGCNACIIACQAENNIPTVGKEQVIDGREMHWIRVDRYFVGNDANPDTYFQPVPCMQCENAPCELVCPVGATVHSDDGLNDMVYNRCVGTRYCSNNCPYKVRRFNFLQWTDYESPLLQLRANPNVTVRSRGVMEKCTYCVQRINAAKINAETHGRTVRDGEVLTACQAACPTNAIVFGNLNDANAQVTKLKADPLNYDLLEELNTRPRTSYLAALRNPNPDLGQAE